MKRAVMFTVAIAVALLLAAGVGLAFHDPQQYPPPEGDPYPTPTPSPSPTPTPSPSNVVTPKSRLVVTSGPAQVITFKTKAGKKVKQMKVGTYTVLVRDRSADHNAHVIAPGYNRKTKVAFVGSQTWKVKLARAGTLKFLCDPHAAFGMRGTAKIVR